MNKKSVVAAYAAIAVVVVICAAVVMNTESRGNTVVIKSGGEVLRKIDLSTVTEPFSFRVDNNGYNIIHVENGRISVCEADCPDGLCIKQSESGAYPIVCLPHRLVIEKAE